MINIINSDSESMKIECDLIFTDPPFDLCAGKLDSVLNGADCNHLFLISTMTQFSELLKISDWSLSFDVVFDAVVPKKSKSIRVPNYTHANGFYMTRNNAKSIFNRKLRQRSDTFDNNGYFPTIIRSPRNNMKAFGIAKNQKAVSDVIGCFDANHIYDPFAGSGTTGFSCVELEKNCTMIELDKIRYESLKKEFRFFL